MVRFSAQTTRQIELTLKQLATAMAKSHTFATRKAALPKQSVLSGFVLMLAAWDVEDLAEKAEPFILEAEKLIDAEKKRPKDRADGNVPLAHPVKVIGPKKAKPKPGRRQGS